MNFDSLCHVLECCDPWDLMFGIGLSCREFRRISKSILASKTSLIVRIEDDSQPMSYMEKYIFDCPSRSNEIAVCFDEEYPESFVRNNAINASSTMAQARMRSIFPMVKEIIIPYFKSESFERMHLILRLFPDIESFKCFDVAIDLSDIIQSIPKLRHFTHLSVTNSLGYYANKIPNILRGLDSYAFKYMESMFMYRSFDNYDFINFQGVQHRFHNLPDDLRKELAKKVTCLCQQFDIFDPVHIISIKYQEFINLKKISLTFSIIQNDSNVTILLNALKMLVKIASLETMLIETEYISQKELINCLAQSEETPIMMNIKNLYIHCSVDDHNRLVIQKHFPSANIVYLP